MRGRRVRHVAVLGCGPAGLFAALAAKRLGYGVDIYSRKVKSDLYGAQYLHAPIPDLGNQREEPISYVLRGTVEGYAEKVYGEEMASLLVSPASLVGVHNGWNIRSAYDVAWNMFEADIVDSPAIKGADVLDLLGRHSYRRVISSIPLQRLCTNPGHNFAQQGVWASGDAPDQDRWAPFRVDPWHVICDGTDDVSWYRASNVFGHATVEYATDHKPPVDNVSRVWKPIGHNCDCFPGLLKVGRYGEWKKGVLAHEAYEKVVIKL